MSQKNLCGKYIGVFDSGFGGLDILRGIVKKLSNYNYIYLGDIARVPYGARSQETIYEFTRQAVDFLFKNNCELIILACNTASSEALRKIQQEYLPKHWPGKKALGVLIPAAEEATEKMRNKKIGIIATESATRSKSFIKEIKKIDFKAKVFQKACPLLVPLIEAGEQNSKATELLLRDYLRSLINKKIDTLILGCTHYGILENKIRKIIGSDISIVSETKVVPSKLNNYLKKHKEIEKKIGKDSIIYFYTTDLTDKFTILGSKFFGRTIKAHKAILN